MLRLCQQTALDMKSGLTNCVFFPVSTPVQRTLTFLFRRLVSTTWASKDRLADSLFQQCSNCPVSRCDVVNKVGLHQLAMDSIFDKVFVFVCGRRTIQKRCLKFLLNCSSISWTTLKLPRRNFRINVEQEKNLDPVNHCHHRGNP